MAKKPAWYQVKATWRPPESAKATQTPERVGPPEAAPPSPPVAGRKVGRGQSARGRLADGRANPIDVHVGTRIRLRRTLLGLSQEKLGDALDLTFQQVQKYERGANRVSASRLFDLARVLDVPVGYFFEDLPEAAANLSPARARGLDMAPPAIAAGPEAVLGRRETLTLVRAYYEIERPEVRKKVVDLALALAGVRWG